MRCRWTVQVLKGHGEEFQKISTLRHTPVGIREKALPREIHPGRVPPSVEQALSLKGMEMISVLEELHAGGTLITRRTATMRRYSSDRRDRVSL